jgi:alpha-tubulin N-acetyltransferase 1
MEFEFNCEHVTKADKSGYAIFSSEKLNTLPKKSYEYMGVLVDTMGKYSSKAQRLASVITSFKRLEGNTDRQKIYFYSQKNICFGYLKTGFKKLFVSTEFGDIKEINPLCVLDFYVSEEVQRQGIGRKLFDLVLEDSGYKPEKIAYDRPSEKLLKFLSKHFGLKRYLPQNNSFVVYSQYFTAFSSIQEFMKLSQKERIRSMTKLAML